MKKAIALCIACFFAVALVGCSSGDNQESKEDKVRAEFIEDMAKWYSFDEDQANEAYDLLDSLGCGEIEVLGGSMTSGNSLDAMRGTVNGHQVNFTADNKKIFYVQITGWTQEDYGWFANWRGKLKYGWYDKKLAFDLYDSDTVSGGYIAFYDAEEDSVIPWSEHK